jgi:Mg2+ and Co2+ transporter CorA
MPRTEVEEHYVELMREIDALEAELPNSQARRHIADVRRRIETLYEMLRENRQLLETILETALRISTPNAETVGTSISTTRWRSRTM